MTHKQHVDIQQVIKYVRLMRGTGTMFAGDADDSEDFTAGYVQALDDLAALLEEDHDA
jgi:hypothetical protein